jgi:hypothetical protein
LNAQTVNTSGAKWEGRFVARISAMAVAIVWSANTTTTPNGVQAALSRAGLFIWTTLGVHMRRTADGRGYTVIGNVEVRLKEFWKDVFSLLVIFVWIAGFFVVGLVPMLLMIVLGINGSFLLLALPPGIFLVACYAAWSVR